jgi:hypothetical protein
MDIINFYIAFQSQSKIDIPDNELKNLIETTECVLAYFGDNPFYGLVTSTLKRNLEEYEKFAKARHLSIE